MRPLWTHQGQRKICDAMVLILGLTPVLLQVDFLDCDHIIDIAAQPQFVTRIRVRDVDSIIWANPHVGNNSNVSFWSQVYYPQRVKNEDHAA